MLPPGDKKVDDAAVALPRKAAVLALKLPIYGYRYSLSMLIGRQCRHLPTCSEYAIDALDRNGPWRGFWLSLSRFSRCRPGGTSGFDPAPDIRGDRHPFAPWRYGRWRSRDIAADMKTSEPNPRQG